MAGVGFGGKRQSSVYLGVGFELVRNAVAPSTERAYQGYFRSWVEFLEFSSEDPMANVRSLLE